MKKPDEMKTAIPLEQGPEIPAPIPVTMMRCATELLTMDEIRRAAALGRAAFELRIPIWKAQQMIEEGTLDLTPYIMKGQTNEKIP